MRRIPGAAVSLIDILNLMNRYPKKQSIIFQKIINILQKKLTIFFKKLIEKPQIESSKSRKKKIPFAQGDFRIII